MNQKSKIQSEAIKAWDEKGRRGILAMCTGSGKSKCAIDIVKRDKPKNVLLVVPTVKLRDKNWEEEFSKWKAKTPYKKLERACYASINKIKNKSYDLVILDEGHRITENNSNFFKNNKVKDILVLTATPPQDKIKQKLLKNQKCDIVFEYSLDQGVKDGVVAPYNIVVIEVPLENQMKDVKAGSKKKPFLTTEQKNYDYLTKLVSRSFFSKHRDAVKWASLNRMRFIYNLKSKTRMAKAVLKSLDPSDRRLIFCGSIKQAEELSPYTYHSKTDDEDLKNFQNEVLDELACVEALNEGMNIPNLDVGIIIQLNSKDLDLVQRIGRIIRYRIGHTAKIIILVSQGTQDVKWAKKALESFDPNRIKYVHHSIYKQNG